MTFEEIKRLTFSISCAIGFMVNDRKSYNFAVSQLYNAYKQICKDGLYCDELSVGLHGSIPFSKL